MKPTSSLLSHLTPILAWIGLAAVTSPAMAQPAVFSTTGADQNSSAPAVVTSPKNAADSSGNNAIIVSNVSAPPTVTTPTSATVTYTSVTLGGTITADGGATLTERGVVFAFASTNANPQIGGTGIIKQATSGTTTGVFTTNLTGLIPGSTYSFTAYATNPAGTGYSPAGTFTTPALTAPAAPTSVSALGSNNSAVVTFTAPGNNGGSDITRYTVTASPGGATATGATSPLVVGGLINGTAYTFTVTATNAIGTGAASAPSAAVTPLLINQQAYVKAVNPGASDNFGYAVAMSASTLVVGAINEASNATGVNGDTLNNSLPGAGAVYIFTRSGTTWTQQAYLKASNPDSQDLFGSSVAIFGDTVVVGAPRESSSANGVNGNQADNSTSNAGAAYVFTRNGTTWSQQAYLKASNPGADDLFGTSVAISGTTIVVGAYQEDSNAIGIDGNQADNSAQNAGAAYVFTFNGTTWSQQAYLKASNAEAGDRFGQVVTISGETIVVGADGEDSNATGVNGNQADNSNGSSGAAYVFIRNGTTWTQQAYLKASNPGLSDAFGRSVALSGDLLVVGADSEDSSASGVNGNQADNLTSGAGAAYVFSRSGTTWTQQAYLKASNPGVDDRFGFSVAISGDKIVVGAHQEASNATGLDGNQADNSAANAGAAYVFQRSGTTWSQQGYLKASNAEAGDFFGWSVAIAGDTGVFGATRESSNATLVGGNQADNSVAFSGAAYVFTIPTAPPTVTTPTSTNLLATSARLGGNIVSPGGATVSDMGIVYSLTATNPNPRIGGTGVTKVASSLATGVFTTDVTGLIGNSAYTFAAYATNSAGTSYSSVGTFATPVGAPSAPTITSIIGGDGLVVVSFAPPANDNGSPITGYTVYFQNGGATSTVTGTSSPIVVSGLINNGSYYFFNVAATNAIGTGPASAIGDAVRPSPTAPQAYLKAGNTGAGDQFGAALAVSGDTLVVGAPDEASAATGINGDSADNTAPGSGAVYVFTRSGTTWTQQAYLKASNTDAGDKFGTAVSVSGDTLVVGAHLEASAATGPGGDQADNSAAGAGAAYIFTRSGTTWTQQAYLKASNTGAGDSFGATVGISGDTVVVGAAREASAATGVGGDQADNTATNAGAVYVFTRSGTTWTQQAYLKASNTGVGDSFGHAVAVAGETVIVGARSEASAATGVNGNQADNTATAAGAAYVFTRSGTTWSQQAYLKASNTGANDQFGYSVAVSGDTVVIGASGEASDANAVDGNQADNSAPFAGAAYVFTRSGTTWTQQAYLKADNSDSNDRFGWSVAIADDSVLVGAYGEASRSKGVNSVFDNNNSASGAAYQFQRTGTTWTQRAYIKATNTEDSDNFGRAVAASGLTLVVGAIGEDSAATGVGGNQADNTASNSGAVYAYTFFLAPTVSAPVSPTIAATTATLGGTIASDGALRERGIVYARTATNAAPQIGGTGVTKVVASGTSIGDFTTAITGLTAGTGYSYAAYATNGVGTTYSTVATFTTTADLPSAPTAIVATSGNGFAVVQFSAPASDGGAAITSYTVTASPGGATGTGTGSPIVVSGLTNGTAYTFTVKATNSVGSGTASVASNAATPALDNQQAYLKASNTAFGNGFGASLAVSGDTLVVGSRGEDTTASNSGAVYIFTRSNSTWKQQAFLKASNPGSNDLFGTSVAISGDTVVIGAPGESSSATGVDGNQADNSASFAGAAYVFTRTGTTWTQQAYLKASNTGANDSFGNSVGISGDTVVVGAPQEGSNATGVNGNQADNSASFAGAAYVFTRSGTTWTQQAYLKASNTGEFDQFGYAVALSGDTAVVGAWREDSPGTGVNGEQASNSLSDSGAAYIFARSGTTWTQQAYLKASSPGAEDYFGQAVATSGDTVVVGAHQEDSNASGANGNAADNSQINAGAAYVYTRSGSTWTQQAYLKASNPGPSDHFGTAVSISGDVVAIGAWGEASSIGGINVNQADDSSLSAGATYVWTRDGSTWTQRAYVKASNARAGDQFGSAVAVSGGTVVASSPLENSDATGVNGNQFNTFAQNSGAAYAFFFPLAPTIAAPTGTGIAQTTATLGGELTADNGAAITERGIVYAPTATNAAPRIGGTGVTKLAATGTALGAFTVDATGLTPATGYSYSAYATNAVGTTYSPAANFTPVASNPPVASVAVPAAVTAKLGATLDFTINWSAAVNVVTTGGTPTLALTVGSTTRTASYVSGSGTTALVFRYTVQAGDLDIDGITVGALALSGGTIKSTSAADAILTLNSVGSTASVNLDGVAPAAPVITGIADDTGASATDGITKDPTLILNGTAEANATVTLSKGGNVIGTTTANGSGAWSFDYTATTLGSGEHSFTATATDLAGNTGVASATYLVTIDTTITAPVITAITTDTGSSSTDRITRDNTLVLTGTADANTTVTVLRNGLGALGTTTANGSGAWSFDYTGTTLPDAVYLFTATATDTAGNASAASADFPVTIDTAAPTLTAVTIASNNIAAARAKVGDIVTVSFTTSENIAAPTVTIAGRTATVSSNAALPATSDTVLAPTSYTATLTLTAGDPEGPLAFSISFTDLAGNAGTAVTTTTNSSSVTFDRTVPTLSPVAVTSSNATPVWAKVGDTVTVSFNASEQIATPSITIAGRLTTVIISGAIPAESGAALALTNYSASTTMLSGDPEGPVAFSISFADLAGNAGTPVTATTNSSSVAFDQTAPVVTSPGTASTTYKAAFSYTAAASGAAVRYGATDLPAGLTINPTSGAISGAATTSGNFTVVLSATDAAGNQGTANLALSIAKVNLTVAGLTANSRVYDATTVATLNTAAATLVGVVAGDTVTLVKNAAIGSFATKTIGTAKPVTVAGLTLAVDATSANYTLTQPATTADITAKPLTVAGATAANKIYDRNSTATLSFTGASLVGVVAATPAEAVSLVSSAATGTFANANAGAGKTVTIVGLTLTGADAGNYTLSQPTATATIIPAPVTVALTNLAQVYDGTPKLVALTVTPFATASLTYGNSGTAAPTNAGSYTVSSVVTDGNYSGSATATLVIAPATQTVTFTAPAGTPTVGTPLSLTATASSGLPVTFSVVSGPASVNGTTVSFRAAGSVVLRATQAGNDNYLPASADRTVVATENTQNQTIQLDPIADHTTRDAPFAVVARASSGLPVTLLVVSGPATLSGSTVVLTGAPGTVVLQASQAGTATIPAAPNVIVSFRVTPFVADTFFGDLIDDPGVLGGASGRGEFFVAAGERTVTAKTGDIAAAYYSDTRRGTVLIVSAALGLNVSVDFTLNANGTYSAPFTSAGRSLELTGALTGSTLTGRIAALRVAFSTPVQARTGNTAALAGFYQSTNVNSSGGGTTTVVGPNGQVLVVTSSAVASTGALGTITADGKFAISAPGATIAGAIDATTTSVSGTIAAPNQATVSFSGISTAVARTDRIVNLSSRVRIAPAAGRSLITGFVVGGTAPKLVLLRGVGPALTAFGVSGALVNPRLQLFDSTGKVIAENDDAPGGDSAAIAAATGAFALAPGAKDAALVATLAPGAYTMQVTAGAETGVGLAEIYDGNTSGTVEPQRLVNISTRGTVEPGADGLLIGGFVITGNTPKRVLVRGIGPGLGAFGVPGTLADPRLAVFSGSTVIAQNDDWSVPTPLSTQQAAATAAELTTAAQATGAFALGAGAKDAAVIITLAPGAYTAQVSGTTTGTALVEVYEIP